MTGGPDLEPCRTGAHRSCDDKPGHGDPGRPGGEPRLYKWRTNVTVRGPKQPARWKWSSHRMARPSLSPQMMARIIEHVRENNLPVGHHLPAQELADALRVS